MICCCLVAQLCPTLWDPMDCSMPGFTVLHHLPEFAQTHVHWVSDAIQSDATAAAAADKSLQSWPTLCDPRDGSPPGSAVPGILQAITVEWVAISFSNAWKWKVKVKSLSHVRLLVTPWTAAYQAPPSMGFARKSTGLGCHCLLRSSPIVVIK